MRLEVYYKKQYGDGRVNRLKNSLSTFLALPIEEIYLLDVYLLTGCTLQAAEARAIFCDPVAQDINIDSFTSGTDLLPGWDILIEVAYKAGVTDPVALTAKDALRNSLPGSLPPEAIVQTAQQYLIKLAGSFATQKTLKGLPPEIGELYNKSGATLDESLLQQLSGFLHNPLIQKATLITRQDWEEDLRPPLTYQAHVPESPVSVEHIDLQALSREALVKLSKERLLALSEAEMLAVQQEFSRPEFLEQRKARGLSSQVTDVELEMIAQTWSEHCKHKIFAANIHYQDGEKHEEIQSLFKTYIKKTTEDLYPVKQYLKSVFHDNSGVIAFDSETLICFKVETHNSPSALDPYGGAITGIVGVNRDIMGTGKGAKPIFNTNVLCFAHPDTPPREVPDSLLHPRRIMEGVHKGIIDGGNQSGIPTVAGGFLFDESYMGKPLVFCGTGGILPYKVRGEESWLKHIDPGDLAVMVGGRIGKDGIHGATFSSQALDEESPTSAVQIGDPITQKKMLDFLLEARDLGLYKGITDNGAGGLSSSLGEMATYCGGINIDLDKCPLKYPGLAPWEILVSESQERMSLAVDTALIAEFLALAAKREVEATVVGEFTSTGMVEIYSQQKLVGLLDLDFLHEGVPCMDLQAVWKAPLREDKLKEVFSTAHDNGKITLNRDLGKDLLDLLSDPNIASKENLVRQYDHEVQAQSVMKPFTGRHEDGPTDGAVLRPKLNSYRGITVTHGICPRYSDYDTYHMAMCAVDEAFRAHIACGGDPDQASALDNFCWPDPLPSATNPDATYKLAQLVRTCQGLREACLAYGLPLISGKDSMKNDAFANGFKISIRPTLLVSLMGIVPDIRKTVTTDFKKPGDYLLLLGETRGELGGSAYERYLGLPLGKGPEVKTDEALKTYKALYQAIQSGLISSCHDLSEGGLGVALAESALGGRLGCELDLTLVPLSPALTHEKSIYARLLFSETPSRFLLSVSEANLTKVHNLFKGLSCKEVGRVVKIPEVKAIYRQTVIVNLTLTEIEKAFKRCF